MERRLWAHVKSWECLGLIHFVPQPKGPAEVPGPLHRRTEPSATTSQYTRLGRPLVRADVECPIFWRSHPRVWPSTKRPSAVRSEVASVSDGWHALRYDLVVIGANPLLSYRMVRPQPPHPKRDGWQRPLLPTPPFPHLCPPSLSLILETACVQTLASNVRYFWLDNAAAGNFTAQPAWQGATDIEPFSINQVILPFLRRYRFHPFHIHLSVCRSTPTLSHTTHLLNSFSYVNAPTNRQLKFVTRNSEQYVDGFFGETSLEEPFS